MATDAMRAAVRAVNPLESSIRTANAIISQRIVGDFIDHQNKAKLADDVAAALNCARLRRERDVNIRHTIVARNVATEIVLARQKLGFPQFVEQAIIRALHAAYGDA